MIDNGVNSIRINGIVCEYKGRMSVQTLLIYLGFNLEVILLDYNGAILQREKWNQRFLAPNDNLEVITLAGGG